MKKAMTVMKAPDTVMKAPDLMLVKGIYCLKDEHGWAKKRLWTAGNVTANGGRQ